MTKQQSRSNRQSDKGVKREILEQCWGEPWPLYASDDLLTTDEIARKRGVIEEITPWEAENWSCLSLLGYERTND